MPDFLSYILCSILLSYFMSNLFCPTCSCPIFCLISLGWSDLFLTDFFSDFSIRFHVRFLPDYCPIFYVRFALSDFFVRIFLSYLFMSDFLSYFLCPILLSYFCPIYFVRLVHVRFFVLFSLSDFLLYILFDLMSRLFVRFFVLFFWPICRHIFGGDFSSKKIEHVVSCIATFVMYCQCVKSFYYYDSIVSRHVWVSSRAIIVLWLLVSYSSSHQWRRT